MTELARGANCELSASATTVSVAGAAPGSVDLMVFQLGANRKVRTDDDFVFFNQPTSPEGAIRLVGADQVSIDLAAVPPDIDMLSVAVAMDDGAAGTLAGVPGLGVQLVQSGPAISAPTAGLSSERAAILLEIYRRNGVWKARNVSAGWGTGFSALVTHHGVAVEDSPTVTPPAPAPVPPPPPVAAPQPVAPPVPARTGSPINLSKITLDKSRPTIDLAKRGDGQGVMRVNLNWSARPVGKGLFGGRGPAIDLDLGCLYELADGDKSVIQALGNQFGSLHAPPFIALDGDDRSGSAAGGENLSIDLSDIGRFRRILIFAMIYDGAPNWAAVDGVITMFPTQGPQVEVRLDSGDNQARICAIAMIENQGNGLSVTRLVEYIRGSQADLDRRYHWGMRWTKGRK